MKKKVCALVVALGLSIGGTVFAAENPFSDVPTGHWAYNAVKQLSEAGIVEGYKDGYYRGQSSISRYEMAIIAGNAMSKIDKANANQKELIQKLAAEFDPEIKTLNSRVGTTASVANKSDLKITGEMRESYDSTENNKNNDAFTRLRLNITKPLTDDLSFFGRVEFANVAGTANTTNLTRAFVAGRAFGLDTVLLGRMPLTLGQGLLLDMEHLYSGIVGADGFVLGGGNKVKVIGFAGRFGSSTAFRIDLHGFNASYAVNNQLNLSASTMADTHNAGGYKMNSAGFNYKASPDVTVTGEYGENAARFAKLYNNNETPKGWFAKVKYRGAKSRQENSYGMWISYRNMDSGFELTQSGTVGNSYVPYPLQVGILHGMNYTNGMTDIKGFEYGYEQTLFRNAVLTLQYLDTSAKTSGTSVRSYTAALNYMF